MLGVTLVVAVIKKKLNKISRVLHLSTHQKHDTKICVAND